MADSTSTVYFICSSRASFYTLLPRHRHVHWSFSLPFLTTLSCKNVIGPKDAAKLKKEEVDRLKRLRRIELIACRAISHRRTESVPTVDE